MGLLENKTIVVTGGSMGIGLTVAQRCAEEGASLILASRHETTCKKQSRHLAAMVGPIATIAWMLALRR